MQIFLPPSFPQPTSRCGKGVAASCLTPIFSVASATALLCQSEEIIATLFAPATGLGYTCLRNMAGSQHRHICPCTVWLKAWIQQQTQAPSRLGLSRSTQFAMFISLQGWDPGPAAAPCVRASNNMLSHMPFPMGVLELLQRHGRAACPCPAQHVPLSCRRCK